MIKLQKLVETPHLETCNFIDYDKEKEIFNYNLYVKKYKVVVKMTIAEKKLPKRKLRFERFNLSNTVYLLKSD